MLLPILHRIDGESEPPRELRLRIAQLLAQCLDVDGVRLVRDEAFANLASGIGERLLCGFDQSCSKLRRNVWLLFCRRERYRPEYPSIRCVRPY